MIICPPPFMKTSSAIVPALLTSGSDAVSGGSFTTASISPPPRAVYLQRLALRERHYCFAREKTA